MNRRTFVGTTTTVAVASLAGCLDTIGIGGGGNSLEETVDATTEWTLSFSSGDTVAVELRSLEGGVAFVSIRDENENLVFGEGVQQEDGDEAERWTWEVEEGGEFLVRVTPGTGDGEDDDDDEAEVEGEAEINIYVEDD